MFSVLSSIIDSMRMITLSTLLALSSNTFTTSWGRTQTCTYPQPCWPSNSEWNSLNSTLHGSLIRARPPAYVCHQPTFDEAQCQVVKQNWTSEFWRAQQPGAYFDTAWESGDSYCSIDGNSTQSCDQGLVPVYVAQAKSVADVQAAVKFAKKHKISTRVKGASHDFLGRSSGNGTFAIQTIKLKGIEFDDNFKPHGAPNNVSPQGVVHVSAGEHWYYVNKAADEHGVIVVGGSSYSVGAAGGWVLGGGHSSMSPQYGLGVDNVVQFEVVTPDGEVRKANAYKNKDLFWALRGGGPGFGVVTKVTHKTHPAITTIVGINVNVTYTAPSYPALLKSYLSLQPALSAKNFSGYSYPAIPVDPSTNTSMLTAFLLVHNSGDLAGANSTLQPFFDFVKSEQDAGRPMTVNMGAWVYSNYFQMWPGPVEQVDEGAGGTSILGSRLLPSSLFEADKVDGLVNFLTQTQHFPIFHLVAGGKVSQFAGDSAAANPSWRKAIHHLVLVSGWETSTPFSVRQLLRQALTQETQKLGALVPGFGSYVNEGDINEPNWKETFWGSNYNRLASIKKSIDPTGIFTCFHCVGYESD
ncbi:FAD-binding domain-containing protein [Serendipita vermifera]|nr:FAD-binding domain-containing protein [Serendipita vermifera]